MKKLLLVAALTAPAVNAQPEGIRGACGLFLEQSTGEEIRLVNQQGWTVIDNRDGTWSVGAKHVRNGRDAYSTCIIRRQGGNFVLVKLTRLL